jgi:drug/metabolite transporter (DMT)-like permease
VNPDRTISETRRGYIEISIGAALISFSAVWVQQADVGPAISGFYRNIFGGIFLLIVLLFRREPLWRGVRPFLVALAAAACFAADLSFWHRSILFIGPGLATLIANFQVFFLVGFGALVFKETLGWRFLLSIPLAVAGLFMVVGIDWNTLEANYQFGVYLGLVSALAYALYLLVLRKSQSGTPRLSASANLLIISFIVAAILGAEGYLEGESFRIPNLASWASMAAYGIFSHAMGWIAISRGIAKVDASRAGLILLLQPTLTFVWDRLFFGRVMSITAIGGVALALGAIYLGGIRNR